MFGLKALKKWRKKKNALANEHLLKAQAWRDAEGNLNERKDLTGLFCTNPFEQFDIYDNGKAYSCCSGWLRLPLGNVNNDPAESLWNSEASQAIRASIHDGSFRFCDHKVCPRIQNSGLPTVEAAMLRPDLKSIIENKSTVLDYGPTFINFCNDQSCNLSCPSCRLETILLTSGKKFEQKKAIQEQIVAAFMAKATDRAFTINVTGSGDPFASKVFREFLWALDGKKFPNMKVCLQTNGVMFTEKNWQKIHKIHKNLDIIIISLDAATAGTYAVTRKGGDWDQLHKNLAFLAQKRREGLFKTLRLDFVSQVDNFTEMPAFVDLAASYSADNIYFSMVTDWGTWPPEIYQSKCIWKETHPRFNEFLEMLKHPNFAMPGVDLGNICHYRDIALGTV